MTHILVIWTLVAVTRSGPDKYDWRPIGEFKSAVACNAAGAALGKQPTQFRCLSKE